MKTYVVVINPDGTTSRGRLANNTIIKWVMNTFNWETVYQLISDENWMEFYKKRPEWMHAETHVDSSITETHVDSPIIDSPIISSIIDSPVEKKIITKRKR